MIGPVLTYLIINLIQRQICKSTIQQFGLGDRVTAECAELSTVPELVSAADVIVLNNVFDWFMPNDAKAKVINQFLGKFLLVSKFSKNTPQGIIWAHKD